MSPSEHAYFVFSCGEFARQDVRELVDACSGSILDSHFCPVVPPEAYTWAQEDLPRAGLVLEPSSRGRSAALAFASCELYRRDPNAVMIYAESVDGVPTAELLRRHIGDLLEAADLPGSMVTLGWPCVPEAATATLLECGSERLLDVDAYEAKSYRVGANPPATGDWLQSAHIHAWSVFALMETFRNFAPVDFQVLNELVRTWNRDPAWSAELYGKLTVKPIDELLLQAIQPGYPTRNLFVRGVAPWSCAHEADAQVV